MSLSYYKCKMCDFKTEKKDEKIWDCHYRDEHGIRITNQCRNCGEIFVSLRDIGEDEVEFKEEIICDECRDKTGVKYEDGQWHLTENYGFWKNSENSVLESLILKEPEKV